MIKLKYIQEILNEKSLIEMPIAVLGNWKGFELKSKDLRIGRKGMDLDWTLAANLKDQYNNKVSIYVSSNEYILGTWGYEGDKDVFIVITKLIVFPRKYYKKYYPNPLQFKKVETMKGFKDKGYDSLLYHWFIQQGYTIISDIIQFDGARNLYNSLAKVSNVRCDIFDEDKGKILIKNTIPFQSKFDDWDFDKEIWSYDFDKSNIRIILTKKG